MILIHHFILTNHQTSFPKHPLVDLLMKKSDYGSLNTEKPSKPTPLDLVSGYMEVKIVTRFFACFLRAMVGSWLHDDYEHYQELREFFSV